MAPDPGRVDPLVGQVVGGRYEIVRRIGKGGMGAIYEVRNTRLGGRSFALKALAAESAGDDDLVARFRREADVIARLKHPNVVDVIDWEALADGSPCLVMEYLQGEDLAQRIYDDAPMPWPFIARVGDQVLSALSVAHAAGVIHRDLKPQNVFLANDDSGEERAKLLDFGVSKIRGSRSLATTDARLIGTPSYMSPEQAEGTSEDVGPGTDVWAMGAILYEMATGELAFDGPNLPQILYRICTRDPAPIVNRRPDAPPAFVELVEAVMNRDPAVRIVDADVLRVRLREALRDVSFMQYPEVLRARASTPAMAVTPLTPVPTRAQAAPVRPASGHDAGPRRRKRFTDALTETIASGSSPIPAPTESSEPIGPSEPPPPTAALLAIDTMPADARLPPTTLPGAATLARRPSWRRWIGIAAISVAVLAAAFAIIAITHDRRASGRERDPAASSPGPAIDRAGPSSTTTTTTTATTPAPAIAEPTTADPITTTTTATTTAPGGESSTTPSRPGGRVKKAGNRGSASTTSTEVSAPPTAATPTITADKPGAGSSATCAAHPDDPICAFGTDR